MDLALDLGQTPKDTFDLQDSHLTVCVTCVWAGVDSAWEQKKLEARKMPENAAESHTSGARCVGQVLHDGFEFDASMLDCIYQLAVYALILQF